MPNSIESIITQLATNMAVDDTIAKVYEYGLEEINEYQVIDIYWDGIERFERESLGTIRMQYRFKITLYVYYTDIKTIQTRQKQLAYKMMEGIWDDPGLSDVGADDTEIISVDNGVARSNKKSYAFTEITILVTYEENL